MTPDATRTEALNLPVDLLPADVGAQHLAAKPVCRAGERQGSVLGGGGSCCDSSAAPKKRTRRAYVDAGSLRVQDASADADRHSHGGTLVGKRRRTKDAPTAGHGENAAAVTVCVPSAGPDPGCKERTTQATGEASFGDGAVDLPAVGPACEFVFV